MRAFKVFMVLKAIMGIAGPIAAIVVWTEGCFKKLSSGVLTFVWSVGPGILIMSMFFELVALYGIRQAWEGGEGKSSS